MGFSVISIHLLIIHRLEELGGLPGPVTALLETFISLSKIIFFFSFFFSLKKYSSVFHSLSSSLCLVISIAHSVTALPSGRDRAILGSER